MVATFRPASRRHDRWKVKTRYLQMCRIFARRGERSPRKSPLNGDFGRFSHGDLSRRQAMIRQTVAENATHGMWRTFVWRGKTRKSHHLAGFRVAPFRVFAPKTRLYDMAQISQHK